MSPFLVLLVLLFALLVLLPLLFILLLALLVLTLHDRGGVKLHGGAKQAEDLAPSTSGSRAASPPPLLL